LENANGEAEHFYRALSAPVVVGLETNRFPVSNTAHSSPVGFLLRSPFCPYYATSVCWCLSHHIRRGTQAGASICVPETRCGHSDSGARAYAMPTLARFDCYA
jgi:hypothetical protein